VSRRLLGSLYVQVLIAVSAGILVGIFAPDFGSQLKPLGDGFVKLIKMVFAPIIFATVVLGIAKMESMKDLGRIGAKALIYFEILSTFARRQSLQTRRRHERRPRDARRESDRHVYGRSQTRFLCGFRAEHDPQQRHRFVGEE